ncbi:MAG TPA: hypothetical protein VMX17_12675 [Candidatus Glassbacteria bacterium]|nr:hypothetical protein [Candidatus Glassbacteria bacterium]
MNEARPMIVTRGDLLRAMLKRMPGIKFYDMMKYVNIIVNILIKRALNNRITIIDGFGVLYRTKTQPKKTINIATGMVQNIVSHVVAFGPHKDFIAAANSDKKFIKEMLKENSRKQINVRTYKKKLI